MSEYDFGLHSFGHDNEPWERDPESEENVLEGFGFGEQEEEEAELYHRPILLEKIVDEVSDGLTSYGWLGAEDIDTEKFLELCELVGVAPEPLRAFIALEDIGFRLEQENYDARMIAETPSVEDIEEYGSSTEPLAETTEATIDAYAFIGRFTRDPILMVERIRAKKILTLEDIENTKKIEPKSLEEFDKQMEKLEELKEEVREMNKDLEKVLEIDEITERRERAFRRMHWLLKQDFLVKPMKEFLNACKTEGVKLDFELLARYLSGCYADETEHPEFPDADEPTDQSDAQAEETETEVTADAEAQELVAEAEEHKPIEVRSTRKYVNGVIDALLQEHRLIMADDEGKSELTKRREEVMLRRLEQAKNICINVFQNDLTDNIYQLSPINPSEYKTLSFVKEQFYNKGDICVLKEVIDLLPGSKQREIGDEELNSVPLSRKFSGRSKMDIFREIDAIIDEHPQLDIEKISHLVEGWQMKILPKTFEVDLGTVALTILEKLALKERHSVRELIR